jgi:ribosomal protein S18 acetylase RimI-like enzyme
MTLAFSDNLADVEWEELAALYPAAPLGDKSAADLKLVFENSRFRVFVREAGALVGAGRALADGRDCSYLCDIAVMPSHQGGGLGREIVARLVQSSASHRKIILYSVAGKERFYETFGFRRMTTAMAIFENPAWPFNAV